MSVAAILVFAILVVVSYRAIRVENTALKKDLDAVGADLEVNRVHSMALEGRPGQAEKKAEHASGEETAAGGSEGAQPGAIASSTPAPESSATAPPISPAGILVEEFEIRRDRVGNVLKFQFHLKNIAPDGRRIAGYTFIVLRPEKGSQEPLRAHPWTPLKDGRPTLFKRGQYFSVARFKVVRGTLSDVGAIDRFKTATVYVYSDTGDLLVEEVFEVDKILQA